MKKLFFLTITVIVFSSCEKDCCYTGNICRYDIPHFIDGYFSYSDVELFETSSKNIVVMPVELNYLCGWFVLDKKIAFDTIPGGVYNAELYDSLFNATKDMYDSLSKVNNDTGYNGCKLVSNPVISEDPIHLGFTSNILSIDVKSEQNFDEQHDAARVLNDLVKIISLSPYPYINSNYTSEYKWHKAEFENFILMQDISFWSPFIYRWADEENEPNPLWYRYYYPINKLLSEVTASELKGIFVQQFAFPPTVPPICYLVFTQSPTLEKTHDLTVTITLDDGRVFEKHITKTWD
jgi:hypothetical protein